MRPVLYIDAQSPYAYLALARAERVLGVLPEVRPVLLGAIFRFRGRGSWGVTDARAEGMAECEARAARYGLPPMRWPEGWPAQTLLPARALAWATLQGATVPFARALFARQFVDGASVDRIDALAVVAVDAGLSGVALRDGIEAPETKDALRAWTDAAWAAGIDLIPTTQVDAELFKGDDRLEDAAAALAATSSAAD